jgi:hypothetical protein
MRPSKFQSLFLTITVLISGILSSCKVKKLASPPHYKFANAFTAKLEDKLKEISGVVYDSKNNYFLAVNDELGVLYFLGRDTRKISMEYEFGPKGDYEDVALYKGVAYILRSDGFITRFERDSTGKPMIKEDGQIPVAGPNDFETLYADTVRKALVLLCKTCNIDDDKKISAFAYYPDSIGFDSKPIFEIDAEAIDKISPFKTTKFQPSAAAIHPLLHKLFIVSATSRQLVIADLNGKVESVYKLASKLFPQPE